MIKALASLRLTVVLLGLAIFVVFAGTLAQVDKGIWTVMSQYFRCWIAWMEFKIFFPRSWNVSGSMPIPGGWLIGAALLANLLVAHAVRIRVQTRGPRLALGVATLAVGAALTWVVIAHVFDRDSSQEKIDPSWRVTLQLLQGGGAALALFTGCWMVFRRKAGIVLLHSGVILLMVSELITGLTAEEAMMTIFEGQTVRFAEDSREVELAILDSSDGAVDDVTAVPMRLLKRGGVIELPGLPFNVEVSRFLKNARLQRPQGENLATRGVGLQVVAQEVSESSGVSTKDGVDEPAAYVTFKDKSGGELGTWLVAVRLSMEQGLQTVTVGGTSYGVSLRFKRIYKPYSLYLHDFRFERYIGTETPKDFSSFVRLEDPERGVARDVRIWMNNPLRYRGETLYQASWDRATEEGTVLQVVENRGWMVPYVACMIVAIGLLGQFLLHLLEFLRKRRVA